MFVEWTKLDVVWLSWGYIFYGFTSLLSPGHKFIIGFFALTHKFILLLRKQAADPSVLVFFHVNQWSVSCICPQRKMLMHTPSSQRQQSSCTLNLGSPASRSRWSIHRTAADAAAQRLNSPPGLSLFIHSVTAVCIFICWTASDCSEIRERLLKNEFLFVKQPIVALKYIYVTVLTYFCLCIV